MQVQQIMRRNPATVRADDHLSTAVQVMAWSDARHLPVLDFGKLAGVLSERDVLRYQTRAASEGLAAPVRAAMSLPPHYIEPEDSVAAAAGRLADERIGCLPVLEGERIIGIITTTDVLRALEREHFAAPPTAGDLVARQIMTSHVMTVAPDDSLADAAARMSQYHVRHLPVVDGEGHVLGMLSDRDLRVPPSLLRAPMSTRARTFLEQTNVAQVMSSDVLEVGPETHVRELADGFADWRLSALPVVDGERHLLGIVSYIDVLRASPPPASS